jgi:hypothetical protein
MKETKALCVVIRIELDFSLDSNRMKEIFYYNRQEQRKRHQQEQSTFVNKNAFITK